MTIGSVCAVFGLIILGNVCWSRPKVIHAGFLGLSQPDQLEGIRVLISRNVHKGCKFLDVRGHFRNRVAVYYVKGAAMTSTRIDGSIDGRTAHIIFIYI